ncbi:MAG: GNAT family N-acetyltransferase [Deltaproteobacteria bacterium]|nr:GNAT family N-acetyltransferase [Deltaproteobacteria bacterium]
MEVSIRFAAGEDDLQGWASAMVEAFAVPGVDRAMEYARLYSDGDVIVAREGDAVVAGLGLCPASQRWGGRDVPFDGVAAVCTRGESRGRGVATALMTAALSEMRARGRAVSALYPASVALYRKVGYELAGVANRMQLRVAELGTSRSGDRLAVRAVAPTDLVMADIDAGAATGNLTGRGPFFEKRRLRDAPRVFALGAGADPAAVAVVGRSPADHGRHDLELKLVWARDAAGMDAVVDLLRNHGSLARHACWMGAPTDPLVMALACDAWEVERVMPWMLRVVDLAAATEARGFVAGLAGVFEVGVEDRVCPWNHGRWRIEIAGGRGRAERVADAPDGAAARRDARGLARLWAGQLADAAHASSPELGAIGQAFAGPTPWLQEAF